MGNAGNFLFHVMNGAPRAMCGGEVSPNLPPPQMWRADLWDTELPKATVTIFNDCFTSIPVVRWVATNFRSGSNSGRTGCPFWRRQV